MGTNQNCELTFGAISLALWGNITPNTVGTVEGLNGFPLSNPGWAERRVVLG
jgi:hypothetical protein